MFKNTLAASATLLILSSTVLAVTRCNPITVTGSYVRQDTFNTPYIEQLKLDIDGGAYYFSSSAFDFLVTSGTFIPQIGSWTCLADGSVLVTTVGSQYNPTGTGDVHIADNVRNTLKLSVVDNNTLQVTANVGAAFSLSDNPLGPGTFSGCPKSNACDPAPYKRIRPQPTDIPQ